MVRTLRLHRACAGNSHLLWSFLTLHSTGIESGLLLGARHAVLETLYSRAHRIGLDGLSCLLDGLRKNISFRFFVFVVVCVLVCPALEVVILAEEQLQGFGDHVGRRSLDELRIELQLSLYRFFDTGLDGDCFWLFRWCFQNGQGFLLSISYKMSDISSDKILVPTDATAQNVDAKCLGGRERPQETFGRIVRKKVGSLPPDLVRFAR